MATLRMTTLSVDDTKVFDVLDTYENAIQKVEKRLSCVYPDLRKSSDPEARLISGDVLQAILVLRQALE